jgi:thiol-disulfide isomerase/thioredoxin
MTASTRFNSLILKSAIVAFGLALRTSAHAQDAAQADAGKTSAPLESAAAIDSLYQKELGEIERRRLERLATLASKQPKDEANRTYELYFRVAIAANLFAEAEPVARRVLDSKDASAKVRMLADVVKIAAEVGRGAYEQSLASLTSALETTDAARAQPGVAPAHPLPLAARLTLLEAYFQQLSQGGQFAAARKAFDLVHNRTSDPAIKAFVASRLARLDMVGKPAPSIAGTDVDGRAVRSADFRGDVVLVVFWATWCVNNVEEVSRLDAVYSAYRERGLRILGINLDALEEGGKSPDATRHAVRQFLVEYNIRWPNLINGRGDQDFARAYAVSEIPANVLIGRDGTVIGLDLARSNLEKAIAAAVGR